ncbi:NAD+ synthase [Fuchsiella alkaliacetigena]|uniref:NAD+ synthase n=1 Tax=Fuchsiella alkaliacetigena TaxID=957042 RepID=UPI00200B2911|nr:NAD+ synthase [Fuchsiella alkaliacetigena]MCK8825672.1 NAD+ synthase [Fuchsiella alkaliacetigena]
MLNKDYQKISEQLQRWIKERVEKAGSEGVVIGISGGIDSSVVAVLSKKALPKNTLALIMPCESDSQDRLDAQLVAEQFRIQYRVIDLEKTFRTLLKALRKKEQAGESRSKLAVANIKPRLRMTVLYYHANLYNSLVVGTDNRSELKLGYFTKFGDGGIDLAPLGNLVKTEVREVAKVLGIPEKIIHKAPSAGLWAGQKDEAEIGLSYEEIDRYILTGQGSEKTKRIVDRLAARNRHKLESAPIPNF